MTTADQAAARRVTYQLETLWDYDYEPTHDELTTLYETAKKNQWNGSTAIDWSRPVGTEGPVLNVKEAFRGTNFFTRLTPDEQKEVEIRISAWRLSQFLHGEQGALDPRRSHRLAPSSVHRPPPTPLSFGQTALSCSIPPIAPDISASRANITFDACDPRSWRKEGAGTRTINSA